MDTKAFDFKYVNHENKYLVKFLSDLDYQSKVMECLYGVHEFLKEKEYEDMLAMR